MNELERYEKLMSEKMAIWDAIKQMFDAASSVNEAVLSLKPKRTIDERRRICDIYNDILMISRCLYDRLSDVERELDDQRDEDD